MSTPLFHLLDNGPTTVAPYSHAVEIDGWVVLTGQIPARPGDDTVPEGIEAQTGQVMDNLTLVLHELGLTLVNVVSARVFLTHFNADYAAMNAVYAGYFPPDKRPARTCIGVTALARGVRLEIDMVARRP